MSCFSFAAVERLDLHSWGVWGNLVHSRPGLELSTKQESGQGEAEGMFSTMACLMYYKQPLFHHESWFKTTALGHKNQLLTTSIGTTIPSVFPSNVDSMINIHPVSSLIISARSLLCTFLLTGVLCAQQLAGKTQRAELLHTKLHREKATSVQCVSSKRALKMQFFP